MIDKTKIIEIIKNESLNQFDVVDLKNLIVNYCVEHGKSETLSLEFFGLILNMPYLLKTCVKTALNYYAVKHEVVILTDIKNNIIKIY